VERLSERICIISSQCRFEIPIDLRDMPEVLDRTHSKPPHWQIEGIVQIRGRIEDRPVHSLIRSCYCQILLDRDPFLETPNECLDQMNVLSIPSSGVDTIHWLASTVLIEEMTSTAEPDRILRRPPPGFRVVVPGSESDESGLVVVEPAGEGEGLFDDARRDFGLKPLECLRLSSPREVDRPDACSSNCRGATARPSFAPRSSPANGAGLEAH